MSISSNTLTWLKGMGKDSIGSIKWRIVTMNWNKTIWIRPLPSLMLVRESKIERDCFNLTSLDKRNIDVCFSLRDLSEGQRRCITPDLKSFLNSCFHISLWQLRGIVNNPSKWEEMWRAHNCSEQQSINSLCFSILEWVTCGTSYHWRGNKEGVYRAQGWRQTGSEQVTACL